MSSINPNQLFWLYAFLESAVPTAYHQHSKREPNYMIAISFMLVYGLIP